MSHMTADNLITISLYLHAKETSRNSVYLISDIIILTSSSFLMKKKNNGLFYLLFLPKYFRASHFMITHFYRNKCTLNHCGLNSWTELCMTQSHFISSLKLLHIITLNRYGKLIKNNYWWKYEQSIKNDLVVSPNSSECIWILMSDRDKQLTAESALLKWTCMSSVVMIVMPHVLMHTWSNYVNVNTSHAGTIHVVFSELPQGAL